MPVCRFVGLLLVTKLLSCGDLAVIRSVYDAVGSEFINRLLLPLGRQQVSTCLDLHGCLAVHALYAHLQLASPSGRPLTPDVLGKILSVPGMLKHVSHCQANALEQAVGTSSLALAMLSSFSRVPDIASSQDILEKVPVLVKVCSALSALGRHYA